MAEALSGLREAWAELASGGMFILFVWVVLGEQVAEVFYSQGSESLRGLVDHLGRLEWFVAAAGSAYLVGSLWVALLQALRESRWVEYLRTHDEIAQWSRRRLAAMPFTRRAALRIHSCVDREIAAREPSWASDPEVRVTVKKQVLHEAIYIAPALLDRAPPTYVEYRRTRSQGELLDALAGPLLLLLLSLLAASGLQPWAAILAAVGCVGIAYALAAEGHGLTRAANSQLAHSIAHGLIETGSLKLLREDAELVPNYLATEEFVRS